MISNLQKKKKIYQNRTNQIFHFQKKVVDDFKIVLINHAYFRF